MRRNVPAVHRSVTDQTDSDTLGAAAQCSVEMKKKNDQHAWKVHEAVAGWY
jgi:hypothetical protein